jgi:deoxyribonuclease (pyrimidine dimer)|tara:strand:+ start:569 stop:994 length:426 start_codon:yes stop_codon:yes gene_type:complete
MTRINIIEPSELTDQHLIAEYREITMVPGSLKRTLASKSGYQESKVSKKFTLNSGHVYFFYNKGKYLTERYNALVNEMKSRGFNPDPDRKFPKQIFIDNNLYHDWMPTIEEQNLVRQRIAERIAAKPNWYRKSEKVLDPSI